MKSVQLVAVTQFPCLLKRRMIPVTPRSQYNHVNKQHLKINTQHQEQLFLNGCSINTSQHHHIRDMEHSVNWKVCKALSKCVPHC